MHVRWATYKIKFLLSQDNGSLLSKALTLIPNNYLKGVRAQPLGQEVDHFERAHRYRMPSI